MTTATPDPDPPAKPPGLNTPGFWMTLVATLAGALVSFGVIPETHWAGRLAGALVATAAAMGYTVARTYHRGVRS